jgi:hypothetical protein
MVRAKRFNTATEFADGPGTGLATLIFDRTGSKVAAPRARGLFYF